MEFSIRNTSLGAGWEDAIRIAAEIGFHGVELVVPEETEILRLSRPGGAREVLSWCEETGCRISSLSVAPYRQHSFAGPQYDLDRSIEFVSSCIRAGANVNAPALLLPHFERESIDLDDAREGRYIEGFSRCAPVAESHGVVIGLETSFSKEQLIRIVDAVSSTHVGVYHDLANAIYYGHDPIEMTRALGKRIAMVHVKELGADLLGQGRLDWPRCLGELLRTGYDGWLVFETARTDDPRSAASRNLKFLRDTIESLGFSPG
jgi:sugar phosphate isomerase/epimerase